MSNRVNVDLSINTKGYVEDINKASAATAEYSTETRKVADATVSFNKEMRAARKAAMDLAAGYAQLSKEDKDSNFGKEMKRQLDEAMEKAAEYIDMQGDLRQQMKNMASDTRVLDTMSEGFGIVADTASTAIGVIAQFTGREEDAKRAVVAFTTAQSALGAMTKIQNALQKQSNTMLAVGKVQTLAAAAAAKIKTAAEAKGVATTKAATAAQAMFNAVAKANPYVLIASAIAAAIGLVTSYIAITKKSADAEKEVTHELTEHEKAIEEVNNTYMSKFASTLAELTIKYTALSNSYRKLNSEYAKTEFIKKYKTELENLVGAINSVAEADRKLINDTEAVKQSFIEKAQAAALYTKLQDLLIKKFEAQQKAEAGASKNKFEEGQEVRGSDVERYGLQEGVDFVRQANQIGNGVYTAAGALKAKMAASTKAIKNAGAQYDADINAIVDKIGTSNLKVTSSLSGGTTTKPGKNHTAEEIKAAAGSIAALESELSKLQELAKKGALPKELQDPEKFADKVQQLKDQIKELKIKWGFESAETLKQKLEEQLNQAKINYELAVEANEPSAIKAAKDAYEAAYLELENHNLKLNLENPISDEDRRKVQEEISKLVNETLNPKTETEWDFSDLPEAMQSAADKTIEQYNRIKDAIDDLNEAMSQTKDPQTINMYKDALEKLEPTLKSTTAEMQKYQQQSDEHKAQKKQAEQMNKRNEALGSYIDMINATSNALGALGESEAAQIAQFTLNTAAMIANAIKTIAAMQAEALASGTASGASLPYPANIAAIATIVATIMSVFASLPKFANGGVVGGNSTVGDKLLARVNSKETILTEKQAANALDMMDSKAVGTARVVGEIDGTKIVLVAKNVMKEMKKSGKNITFG